MYVDVLMIKFTSYTYMQAHNIRLDTKFINFQTQQTLMIFKFCECNFENLICTVLYMKCYILQLTQKPQSNACTCNS